MIRWSTVRRPSAWLAVVVAGVMALAGYGHGPGPAPHAPGKLMKNEKRRVIQGPDSPDEALRWVQIGQRDQFGQIAANGMIVARQQTDAMRARDLGVARQTAPGGGPVQLPSVAGIDPGNWTWIGPGNIGGRTRALVIDPTSTSTMFAGSVGGGLWKSTNAGASWAPVNDFMANLAISSLLIQPNNPSVMFAGTGEGFFNQDAVQGAGIFRSVNGGATWTQLPSTAPTAPTPSSNFAFVNELAMSADGTTLLAATRTGLFRSVNLGDSWTQVSFITNMMDVKFLAGSSTNAVASNRQKAAYYSTNGGQNWSLSGGLVGGSSAAHRVELAVGVSLPNVVYASVEETTSQIWQSFDGGQNYSLVNGSNGFLSGQGWYDNAIWVDPTNANTIIVGGLDLWRSTDGGTTLTKISTWSSSPASAHADHHGIISDPGFNGTTDKKVYFINDGGIYRADDVYATPVGAGIPFTYLNNNYGVTQFYGGDGLTSNGKIFGGTQDNYTLLYTPANGPQAWTQVFSGDGGYSSADRVNNYLYGEYVFLAVHRSINGAFASFIYNCGSPGQLGDACSGGSSNFISPVLLDPNNPDRLLGGGGQLWLSTNPRAGLAGSVAWSSIKPSAGSNISWIAVAPGNSDVIWTGHNNGFIFNTSNGTASSPSWTSRIGGGLPAGRAINSVIVDPSDSNTAYVGLGGFVTSNVWVTHNFGASWTDISGTGAGALPAVPVRSVVPHPSIAGWLYAGTEVGVFASEDGGATWHAPQDGPANVSVFQLFWMGTKLVAVTHGRGMFTADVTPPATPPTFTTQPLSQTVSMGAAIPLSVQVTGSVPLTYQWYRGAPGDYTNPVTGATSATFTTPGVFTTTSYFVRASNAVSAVDSAVATLTPQTGLASYDSGLLAPRCTVVSNTCDTFAAVDGRSFITGGIEPNQPNTINNSCFDGASGTYHVSQSIDRVKVATLDSSPFAPGKTVKIDVNVWVVATGTDRLDLYGAPNAANPVWTLIGTLTPPATGAQTLTTSTYVLPAGTQQAIRAHFRNSGGATPSVCGTGSIDDQDDLVFAVGPAAGVEMVANGDFSTPAAPTNWLIWEAPNIVSSVVGGVFQFFQNTPPVGSGQSTIFQNTGMPVVAGGPLLATFQLGNSSTVRKRISVLVIDSDFSDISVCTFWLPAGQTTLKSYTMQTHTTKGWTNASIYFYAATPGSNGGNYLLDNVSLKYTPPTPAQYSTICTDPNAPATSAGAASGNLLTNGDFSGGLTSWSVVQPITAQVAAGVLQFLRPTSATPAGLVMQSTGQVAVVNQLVTATFALGNSSNVRKRVTVLLHDLDLVTNPDLTACTFWLPPGLVLSNYTMRGYATQQWTNATISFYPATVGTEQWILLDNVTLSKIAPTAGVIGTECIEPIGIAFPVSFPGGGSGGAGPRAAPAEVIARTSGGAMPATGGGKSGGSPGVGRVRMVDDQPGNTPDPAGWRAEATTNGVAVLSWADPIDLAGATNAQLRFASFLSPGASSGEVQVSEDDVSWQTLASAPQTGTWSTVDVDLSDFAGRTIRVRFVYNAVAPGQGVMPDVWLIGDVWVWVTGKGGLAEPDAGRRFTRNPPPGIGFRVPPFFTTAIRSMTK